MDSIISYLLQNNVTFVINPETVVTWVFMFYIFKTVKKLSESIDGVNKTVVKALEDISNLERRQKEMHEDNMFWLEVGKRKER